MAERVRQSQVRGGAHRGGRAPRTPSKAQPRSRARAWERDRGRGREPGPGSEPEREPGVVGAPPGLARLMASGAGNRAVGAYLREEARSAGGQELAPPLRAEMESRLGADLSAVRLHTSTAAAESANALRARAFTVDQDVVFAAGEYRPGDPGGRALIAHELAHTVQQARGGPAPAGTDRTERAAAAASAAGARGTAPAPVLEGSAVGVARVAAGEQTQERTAPEKQDSLGFWGDLLVDELAGVAVGSGLQQQMLKAAVIGFFAELDRQIQDPKSRADIHAGAMDLAKSGNQEKMIAAYYAGAAAGLVSPLTDLLGIGVLLEQLQAFGGKLATGVLKGEIDLIDEVTGLVGAYEDFKYHLAASLIETIKEHPEDLFFFGGLQDVAVRKAGEAGRTGARRVVAAISEKDGDKPAAPETAKQILTQHTEAEKAGVASAVTSKATRARQAVFHTHPERLGYDVGEAVGSAVGNLLIAVFTEGVGNAVTRIAGEIGRVCPVLARGAEALAEIGKAITAVENAIGALVEGALSTLKGLGRILGPFRALMTRLRNFLGKVVGRAAQLEAAALRAAESTAPKLAPKAVPGLPGPGKAGTPHAKPSAAPKRGRSRPGGGAVNDNDVPLRKGETVKEPSPKAADPTARPQAPEPHPQSGVQPAARATEEQAEEQAAQQVEQKIAVNAPPPAHTPTTAAKTPPPKKPATLKVVPPPKGAPAPVKPVSPKGTTGPGKKPVTAATKAELAAKRAEARAVRFKRAAPAAPLYRPADPRGTVHDRGTPLRAAAADRRDEGQAAHGCEGLVETRHSGERTPARRDVPGPSHRPSGIRTPDTREISQRPQQSGADGKRHPQPMAFRRQQAPAHTGPPPHP
ncbi:DUF4157 domain-containing protein [Streptomyces sp. KCTC 0041BP]|uniref:eCIS core domain-containing protein n=1 Tax=Streptomyces sp. KCTC 0041BP TaxID=201500 RepID=UPI001FD80647|nr:DUF4157 domain-containing protein [Streptomyces sp. KCTC 0041BP]